jgi:endonuclease/exonuclease/phosphatase family metal-dependent hydrolase
MDLKIISLNLGPSNIVENNVSKSKYTKEVLDIRINKYKTHKLQIICNEIEALNPDIICFQEFDNIYYDSLSELFGKNYANTINKNTYTFTETPCSHVIFYKKTLSVKEISNDLILLNNDIYICGLRLAPYSENAHIREKNINDIIKFNNQSNKRFIFIGDLNCRKGEFVNTTLLDEFYDAYTINELLDHKYTVNGYNNKYFTSGQGALYKYKSRYDRAYCTNDIELIDFKLVFKNKYEKLAKLAKNDGCVSDHYGIELIIKC